MRPCPEATYVQHKFLHSTSLFCPITDLSTRKGEVKKFKYSAIGLTEMRTKEKNYMSVKNGYHTLYIGEKIKR